MIVLKQNKTENALFQDFSCFFFTKSETIVLRGWVEGWWAERHLFLGRVPIHLKANQGLNPLEHFDVVSVGAHTKHQKVFGNSLGACLRVTRGP